MKRVYHIVDEAEGYNQKSSDDIMLEKAFKEGCEHGYKKAMREIEGYNERKTHTYNEGFEEKIERLKKKYG
jgi:flagellar biosynthesis/type III secretory pathway protein FliH